VTAPAAPAAGGIVRPRTWRVDLPPKTVLLTSNERLAVHPRAARIKALRHTGWAMARYYKLPRLERAHVIYVLHPNTTTRRRDPGNWAPSAKAVIDGFVDAGLLPDDNSERLLGPDPRIGEPVPGSQLVFYITDMDAMDPAHIALLNPETAALEGTSS
jgi:crossover junction endodeoxyribonuclease RusA